MVAHPSYPIGHAFAATVAIEGGLGAVCLAVLSRDPFPFACWAASGARRARRPVVARYLADGYHPHGLRNRYVKQVAKVVFVMEWHRGFELFGGLLLVCRYLHCPIDS